MNEPQEPISKGTLAFALIAIGFLFAVAMLVISSDQGWF